MPLARTHGTNGARFDSPAHRAGTNILLTGIRAVGPGFALPKCISPGRKGIGLLFRHNLSIACLVVRFIRVFPGTYRLAPGQKLYGIKLMVSELNTRTGPSRPDDISGASFWS